MCATCVYVPTAHSYTSFLRIIIPLPWDRNRLSPRLHGFKCELHARVYVPSPGCFSQRTEGFCYFLNLSDFAKLPSKNGPWTDKYLNTHISTQLLFAQPLDSRRKWYFRGGFFLYHVLCHPSPISKKGRQASRLWTRSLVFFTRCAHRVRHRKEDSSQHHGKCQIS